MKLTKIHIAGLNKDNRDKRKVYFKDGFAYCTDNFILVKQSLEKCFGAKPEEIELLNGNSCDIDLYKLIGGKEVLIVESEKGIILRSVNAKKNSTVVDIPLIPEKYAPPFESTIPINDSDLCASSDCHLDPDNLSKLFDAMFFDGLIRKSIRLLTYASNRAVKVVASSIHQKYQVAVIMPILANYEDSISNVEDDLLK
jgi:hypothetical protein